MKKKFIALTLLPLCFSVFAHPTPEILTKEIENQGAKAIVAGLYANEEKEWQYVTTKISKGETSWLRVALLLAAGTDAASAETLSSAVALAIPHNPDGVVNIMTDRYTTLSVRQVCSLPFYSMTEGELNQYVVSAIRALYKVAAGKNCLDTLVKTIGQSDGFNQDN